jgi:hypothetical protein
VNPSRKPKFESASGTERYVVATVSPPFLQHQDRFKSAKFITNAFKTCGKVKAFEISKSLSSALRDFVLILFDNCEGAKRAANLGWRHIRGSTSLMLVSPKSVQAQSENNIIQRGVLIAEIESQDDKSQPSAAYKKRKAV